MRKLTSRGANVLAQTLLQPGASDLTGSFRCAFFYLEQNKHLSVSLLMNINLTIGYISEVSWKI
jgi:hypothetical protein